MVKKTAPIDDQLQGHANRGEPSMVKRILIAIAAIVVVLVIGFVTVVAVQPSHYRVTRSATMAAPADKVFAQANDFHNWENWSPWLDLDPAAKTSYEGPSSGEGAIFRWAGNENVGEGSMTITESVPSERIKIKLAFLKPFEDTADVDFAFEPAGGQTRVTWSMAGKKNFMGKAICLFMDMDKMIGGNYAEGLARMKKVVEAPEKAESATAEDQTAAPASEASVQ